MLRLRSSTPALLDFLAPSLASHPPRRAASSTAREDEPPSDPEASTSKSQPTPQRAHHGPPPVSGHSFAGMLRQQANAARKAAQLEREKANSPVRPPESSAQGELELLREPPSRADAPRRKPIHKRPPSSSIAPTQTNPIAFLERIRAIAPIPTAEPPSTAISKHNKAIQALSTAGWSAYESGWIPIRDAGEANRVDAKGLNRALAAAQVELAKPSSRAQWTDVRQLVLWIVGKDVNIDGVNEWARNELKVGQEGAARVVDVWDALAADEHLELVSGDNSLSRSWKPPIERKVPASTQRRQLPDLFAAYVAARAILHTTLPSPPPFHAVLPSLLAYRQHLSLRKHAQAPQIAAVLANRPADATKALAWIRQVALADMWAAKPGGEGLDVAREAKAMFRRTAIKDAWELWLLVREAIESPAVAWITVAGWDDSQARRWLNGSKGIAEERSVPFTDKAKQAAELPQAPAPESDAVAAAGELPLDTPGPTSVDASFTQALAAVFLAGFTRLECYSEAGDIWGWLSTRSPPLSPGVVAWNALVHGYAQKGNLTSVDATLLQMSASGVVPDVWTSLDRAEAYFFAKRPDDAMDVFAQMFKSPAVLKALADPHVARLVHARMFVGLFASGRAGEAQRVLERMEQDGTPVDVHILNICLRHHTDRAKPDFAGAVDVFRRIASAGLEPDVFTFTMLFQALLRTGDEDATQRLIKIMDSTGVKPTATTYGALINHLAKSGSPPQLRSALALLDEMERRGMYTNEIIYTSLIQGLLRAIPATTSIATSGAPASSRTTHALHPYFVAAQALQKRMSERGIQMNRVGYNTIISAALALKTPAGISIATAIFRELMQSGRRSSSLAGEENANRARAGQADSWYVFIDGFANMGDWATARKLVREMEGAGFVPRSKGFLRLVDKVQRGGWVV